MRIVSFPFLLLSSILFLLPVAGNAQTQASLPPPPSGFDPKAQIPPNLPQTLVIPKNMRIEVSVWRKKPIHYPAPPDPNSLDILMDPDLESAVIERNADDIHVTFHWQGGHTSEAFIIRGFCFRMVNLKYPTLVIPSKIPLNFWLNRQDLSGETSDDFPELGWYAPKNFAGTASLNGADVLVFPQDHVTAGTKVLPDSNYVCLDSVTHLPIYLDDGLRVFTFTYTPDSNIQINPQGAYLKAIQKQFGH